jgi:RNA polymerase sigma-70 factor, ECF subfamily
MKPPAHTDEDLLAAYRGGDETAFQELFERYESRVLAYLVTLCGNLELARDLTQETFLKLATRPPRMLFGGRVQAWLFRVGRNLAMDQFRRPTVLGSEPESPLSPHEELARQDDNTQLHRLLSELPEDLRHIVSQRLFARRTFREIAAADSIPMGTAMWRMHRALGMLRRQLREEEGRL